MLELIFGSIVLAFGFVIGRGWQAWRERQLRWWWRWSGREPNGIDVTWTRTADPPQEPGWFFARQIELEKHNG